MILTSQAELTMLRKGQAREIAVRKGQPRPGAKAAKCRWTVGRDYTVTARALRNQDGETTKGEQSIRCMVIAIADDTDRWLLSLTARAMAERTVFLAANPGAQRGDYTLDPAHALHDEPEIMGEDAIDILARLAKEDRATRRPDRRPWAA